MVREVPKSKHLKGQLGHRVGNSIQITKIPDIRVGKDRTWVREEF